MKRFVPPAVTFMTIIGFNVFRFVFDRYFLYTPFYQRILYDNLHHWQLGSGLIAVAVLSGLRGSLLKIIFSVGVGMVIDESMYVMGYFGFARFTHDFIEGVLFSFGVFGVYVGLYLFITGFFKKSR